MSTLTKRLSSVPVITLAIALCGAALAGQEPYIAAVGDDLEVPGFYLSPKEQQFLHANTHSAYNAEGYSVSHPTLSPEICDTEGTIDDVTGEAVFRGNANALIPHGNAGWAVWDIVLPKKPAGNINIVLQLGILKPEAFVFEGFNAINVCAGETGERIGQGFCTRLLDQPGVNPVLPNALPYLTAQAYPGPFASPGFNGPFNLTAYRQPGTFAFSGQQGKAAMTVLNGGTDDRIVLKACQSESVLAKIPVTGYTNFDEQREYDLEAGDRIRVRLDLPRGHTMDMYVHAQSLRIGGNGRPETLLP